jgi:hypothetical protein
LLHAGLLSPVTKNVHRDHTTKLNDVSFKSAATDLTLPQLELFAAKTLCSQSP